MRETSVQVKNWEQLSLIDDRVYEVTLKVGIVAETDHVQLQLEAKDPRTDHLIELQSQWDVDIHSRTSALDAYIARLRSLIMELSGPF